MLEVANRDVCGWVKYFADGDKEIGTDKLIQEGKASWKNGCLENITAVGISENRSSYMMVCPLATEWWQGDGYHARFTGSETKSEGKLVKRFVQLKVNDFIVGKYIVSLESECLYKVLLQDNPERGIFQLKPEHKDMWLTLEVKPGIKKPSIKLKTKKG